MSFVVSIIQKRIIIYILIIGAGFFGCKKKQVNNSNQNQGNFEIIKVDLEHVQKPIRFSEIYENIKYLKLETTETNILRGISKISINDSRIYLFSSYPDNTVSVYSLKGEFLFQIIRKGKGPGEYQDLRDMHVNQYIELLDRIRRKIIKFNLNGAFISEDNIGILAYFYHKWNNDTLIFYANNTFNELNGMQIHHNLFFMSLNNHKIISKFIPIKKNFEPIKVYQINHFTKFKESLLFFQPFNDTIYQIYSPKMVLPRYIVDFGNQKIPDQLLSKKFKNVKELILPLYNSKYAWGLANFREFDNVLFFTFNFKKKNYNAYYSKTTKEIKYSHTFINDLDQSKQVINLSSSDQPIGKYNGSLIYYLEPDVFISRIKEIEKSKSPENWLKFKEENQQLLDIYETTTLMDNPILVFIKLKDF